MNQAKHIEVAPVMTNTTCKSSASSSSPTDVYNAPQDQHGWMRCRYLELVTSLRSHLGLEARPPVDHAHCSGAHDSNKEPFWPHLRAVLREPLGEFFGTFILIMFGDGSVAQVLLSTNQTTAPGGHGFGNYQSISWGWGIGVMLGVYVAGDSGGHLNPAITFTNCLYRGLPWKRFPVYFLAQFLGAFAAAGVVYANYKQAIDHFEGGPGLRTVPPAANATAGIFCTYPQGYLTTGGQFVSEFVTSSLLMFVIYALKDDFNAGAMGRNTTSTFLFPLAMFFLIFGLGACFGVETGYAINLARDLAPRLMSYAVGYGTEVWSAGNYYFWVGPFASFVGCVFGGGLYDAFMYTGPETPFNKPYFGLKDAKRGKAPQGTERQEEAV